MEQTLNRTIAILSHTPAALNAFLRDLPEDWTHANEGENTWSVYDILGHLVHAEHVDWMSRVRTILDHGESQPFVRFDRFAQFRESEGKSLPQLLDEFASVRVENLNQLRSLQLTQEKLDLLGRHPVFGPVTLSQLLATWANHDLTHLHQISRVMAYQYRQAVGPWVEFLGVLKCAGHSS